MKHWQLFLHFLLVFCTFQVARPLNILALIGSPIQRHYAWYRVLFEELVARKHNLTIISIYGAGAPILKTRPIKLNLPATHLVNEFPYRLSGGLGPLYSLGNLFSWYQAQEDHCKHIMEGSGYENAVAELLSAPPKIDLILYDITFDPWCVLMMADFYRNVSIFALSAFKALPEHFEIARGGVASPGITPSFISHYTENMDFFERFWNAILYWFGYYLKFWATDVSIAEFMEENPTIRKYGLPRQLTDIMSRIKLIFVNSHPAIDYSIPLPPNIIEIGGMHVRKLKELHPTIANLLAKGQKGVIFMDLGKHMSLQKLGPTVVNDMLNVIKRNHDYMFLWHIEISEPFEEHPDNLFAQPIFPMRNEILAHPNVKLFITQADHLNIQESIYFGVPLVVIPLNMDQPNNAVRVAERKFGQYIFYHDINVASFHSAITDTLSSEECIQSVQMAKHAIHNNPQKPLDTIIGWIEKETVKYPESFDYIVSRSAKDRGFLATHSIDIILMVPTFTIMSVILIAFLLYCIAKCCSKKKRNCSHRSDGYVAPVNNTNVNLDTIPEVTENSNSVGENANNPSDQVCTAVGDGTESSLLPTHAEVTQDVNSEGAASNPTVKSLSAIPLYKCIPPTPESIGKFPVFAKSPDDGKPSTSQKQLPRSHSSQTLPDPQMSVLSDDELCELSQTTIDEKYAYRKLSTQSEKPLLDNLPNSETVLSMDTESSDNIISEDVAHALLEDESSELSQTNDERNAYRKLSNQSGKTLSDNLPNSETLLSMDTESSDNIISDDIEHAPVETQMLLNSLSAEEVRHETSI